MGHDVFSMGSYINPLQPHDNKRPPVMGGKYYEHLIAVSAVYSKDNLHPDIIEPFDIIVVDHIDSWIANNWDIIKHKKVVLRTIGQNTSNTEFRLQEYRDQGLKVVRYSPKEANIPLYVGSDAMIRFYKDPDEFKDYNGNINDVVTLGQSLAKRAEFCNYDVFDQATTSFSRSIYGSDNQDIPGWKGQPDYEGLKKMLRDHRVFFYTGTQPASYTLGFIEAFMTGIPIVAIGNEIGNSMFLKEQDTYEVPDIIQNGINGFCSDNIPELREYVERLLNNSAFAKQIGDAGRKTAIELFGKDVIREQWKNFFNSL